MNDKELDKFNKNWDEMMVEFRAPKKVKIIVNGRVAFYTRKQL